MWKSAPFQLLNAIKKKAPHKQPLFSEIYGGFKRRERWFYFTITIFLVAV